MPMWPVKSQEIAFAWGRPSEWPIRHVARVSGRMCIYHSLGTIRCMLQAVQIERRDMCARLSSWSLKRFHAGLAAKI